MVERIIGGMLLALSGLAAPAPAEQSARIRALFAAADDETTSDRARIKVIDNQLGDPSVDADRRKALRVERKLVADRLAERAKATRNNLVSVLNVAQVEELETS